MKTKYISTTDTAKIIRKVLKESFPGVKFSVCLVENGRTVRISWLDGPSTNKLGEMLSVFERSGNYEPEFIDLKRGYSDAGSNAILRKICNRARIKTITIDDISKSRGVMWNKYVPSLHDYLGHLFNKENKSTSFGIAQYSETLASNFPGLCQKAA